MFDHVGIAVSDFGKSVRFYQAALEPLGYRLEYHDEKTASAGFGKPGAPQLWLNKAAKPSSVHFAVAAENRKAVAGFHAAAVKAGGRDNGAPGPRPDYGPTYYAAFVHDPDGNNVEAVCLRSE
ncbi:MAG TPA: VOC family protein [Myxococcaceae bacterium]|nr:VOC family protein [Myxococcaceae bacterium]